MMKAALRISRETDPRLQRIFLKNFGLKGYKSIRNFQKRQKRNEPFFPAFLMISVTSRCNLSCRGCWARGNSSPGDMSLETLDGIINEAKNNGSYFFGILGGEPLLVNGLLDLLGRHDDAYFLLFTNGSFLDGQTAGQIRRHGNISPLISFEGIDEKADDRRGGKNIHASVLTALDHCRENRLITGTAVSLCKTNLDDLATENFIHELAGRGIHYLWYYIYRPVGPDPSPELCLDRDEIRRVREFLVNVRRKAPLMVVDAYWDHQGRALCPGASGLSHHINAAGDIELCPPLQYSRDRFIKDSSLSGILSESVFLKDLREFTAGYGGGCPLLENPRQLASFLKTQKGLDSSGRNSFIAELENMSPRPGHNDPDYILPEKSLMYRFMKKNAFFGWGAYG